MNERSAHVRGEAIHQETNFAAEADGNARSARSPDGPEDRGSGESGGDHRDPGHEQGQKEQVEQAIAVDALLHEMRLLRQTTGQTARLGETTIMLRAVETLSRALNAQRKLGSRTDELEELLTAVAAEVLDGPREP